MPSDLPYVLLNEDKASPLILTAEHAGRAFPAACGMLGLFEEQLAGTRNLAGDWGAGGVARRVAEKTGAPALLGRYSRLVIDLNRAATSHDLIPLKAHGIAIPGNADLTPSERAARLALYHAPFHQKLEALIARVLKDGKRPVFLSIHSFTPSVGRALAEDKTRPMPDIGLLYKNEGPLLTALREVLAGRQDLTSADNFPYDLNKVEAGSLHLHGIAPGFESLAVEISIDKLRTPEDELAWGELLAKACALATS